ncbi:unnamed protein product [Larinioides sclopetarius]|uniref:Uncharacterized protein n=1 Tax=Larinioides sclopetarius TaxID=280406 RepID=A0AAV2BHC7_9ARAC
MIARAYSARHGNFLFDILRSPGIFEMSVAPLYDICLDRICDQLREGLWNSCNQNPFSNLPTRIVNELMKFVLSHHEANPPKIRDVTPLLTSGKLTYFNLCPFDLKAEHEFLMRILCTKGCISSRNLDSYSEKLVAFYYIRKIVSGIPNLEELHLNIQPDFDIFRKCENLRILRFYTPSRMLTIDYFFVDLSVLSSLRNLEVLYIPDMDADTIVKVLDLCPKLISLGLVDSLNSMKIFFHTLLPKKSLPNFDSDNHFQLRRCVWGDMSPYKSRKYRSKFSLKVKYAVTLCPLVEELIIRVPHKDALEALRELKHLILLRIDFRGCKHDFVPNFLALLQDMGPQLQHLSVRCFRPVPVDIICDSCPNLQSLEIEGLTFVENPAKGSRNLCLKRLRLLTFSEKEDKDSFLFLLANCKRLEELYLDYVFFLDDALLNEIFKMNPLKNLKVSCIDNSRLTWEGIRMFKIKIASIQTVDISSSDGYYFCNRRLYQNPNIYYIEYVDIREEEFFYRQLNENRF